MGTYVHPRALALKLGSVAPGALLNFYEAGTSTRKATYDEDGNANANPVVADANGIFPYIQGFGPYKVVLTDSAGAGGFTEDNYLFPMNSAGAETIAYTTSATWGLGITGTSTGVSTGDIIETTHYDSNLTIGSGAKWQYTGTTTAGKAGTVNADGYVYDADGKQFKFVGDVNVRAFGAVGDGSTDDTTAIQNAINSDAKNIFFPQGTYNHSGLTLKAQCRYYGEGMEASRLVHTGTGGNALSYTSAPSAKIQLVDLWISGNGVDTARVVNLENANFNAFMVRCRVNDGVINVYLTDSWTFTFSGCHIYGAGTDDKGITNNCIYTDGWEAGKILNCRIEDSLQDLIVIDQIVGAATNFFVIGDNTSLQRCGDRAVWAKTGQGKIQAYMERINDDNSSIAALEFDDGGYSEIERTYLTNSGASTVFCDFEGNSLVVQSSFQSSSGGTKGLEVAAIDKLVTIGNRFFVATPYNVNATVSWVNLDQNGEIAFREDSLLIGDISQLDSSSYALDLYAENKSIRFSGSSNLEMVLNSPANRRLNMIFQSAGTAKAYFGRGDSDNLGDDVIYLSNADNDLTPIMAWDMSTGRVKMSTLPTSSAGLASGEIWSNSGVLTVV